MNTATKLAWHIDSKSRCIRRLVESSSFQFIYNKAKDKELAEELIVKQDLDELKLWIYKRSSLYDAPTRWLKSLAKYNKIPNYSRMTKVELVKELTRKSDIITGDDGSTISRGWG